jgi:hypothetical protein
VKPPRALASIPSAHPFRLLRDVDGIMPMAFKLLVSNAASEADLLSSSIPTSAVAAAFPLCGTESSLSCALLVGP